LGANDDGTPTFFAGRLDEARLATTTRSIAWVKAEYLTMTNSFVTVGAAQSAPASGGVMTNDSDADSPLVSAALVSGPSNAASFAFNADGTFSYTPVANFNGADSFTYRTSDGLANSSTVTVTLNVTPVNDAPV